MNNIAIVTTFPNHSWDVYAKEAMQSWAKYLPPEMPVMVQLDNDLLKPDVERLLRPQDAVACGWTKPHADFVERNKGKDHPTDYRKQAVRFCHKVFAMHRALEAIEMDKKDGNAGARYLIWMDADVIINRFVSGDEIKEGLPKEGDAVAYLGRKDWDHSECGWLAFDLENGGDKTIKYILDMYIDDSVFSLEQWHDSWVFDYEMKHAETEKFTNLTTDKPGMDIWPHSPMGKWSTHYKGPAAKNNLAQKDQRNLKSNVVIQTRNSLPDEQIKDNIRINNILISNWIQPCLPSDEEIVIVSAGPTLIAEDVRVEQDAGRKIVAVKHALEPLKKAGIKPWMCILLDPRPHVADFVKNPDTEVIWLVASQVNPEVTKSLLEAGCKVWGYHAAVGAGEEQLFKKNQQAVVMGGSATATRGMYALNGLGFSKFRLYGYDLCYPDKPENLDEKDKFGQPKYMDISISFAHPLHTLKRCYWTEPQLVAQFEELNEIIKTNRFQIKAFGTGMIPDIVKAKETGELRERELKAKLPSLDKTTCDDLFTCSSKTNS